MKKTIIASILALAAVSASAFSAAHVSVHVASHSFVAPHISVAPHVTALAPHVAAPVAAPKAVVVPTPSRAVENGFSRPSVAPVMVVRPIIVPRAATRPASAASQPKN